MNSTLRLGLQATRCTLMNSAFVTQFSENRFAPKRGKIASLKPTKFRRTSISRSSVFRACRFRVAIGTCGKGRPRKWPLHFRPFRRGFSIIAFAVFILIRRQQTRSERSRFEYPATRFFEVRNFVVGNRRNPQHRLTWQARDCRPIASAQLRSSSHFASSCLMLA